MISTNLQDPRDPRLRAWAYLSRVVEGPCRQLLALINQVGPEDAARAVQSGGLPQVLDRPTRARRQDDHSARDLELLIDMGGELVTPDSREWPAWRMLAFDQQEVRQDPDAIAPIALWKRGAVSIDEVSSSAVAVVGTRAPSSYGEQSTIDMACELSAAGCTIVSGAAYGIDACAHRAALAGQMPTVAVLACGIDQVYPSGHDRLLSEIVRNGAVVTEYPPGTRPARFRFLARNRLVAALSDAVLVTEAGKRSGARNTARWGRLFGKPVYAMPGPVTSVSSVGCHQMIRTGEASLVTCGSEVLSDTGLRERAAQRMLVGPGIETETKLDRVTDGLDRTQLRVFDSLPMRGGASLAEIAVSSGVPATSVQAALAVLEIGGLAQRGDAGWRRAKRRC
ncbi:DNA-processing protein DprA [Hoyosella altamirensis]|uniref:DNA processing protein n=1 Tax=Hoyosella altamirensis TaxID=616997 RepID=A0A839RR81_9ACTN|nr:DNA-processing protein DprA [Hoyosella altamirensis]MBB3038614.1 DNA processing protein [Hoyosella altamirensis]